MELFGVCHLQLHLKEIINNEWDIVTGVDKLPAQKGLVISTLLDLK